MVSSASALQDGLAFRPWAVSQARCSAALSQGASARSRAHLRPRIRARSPPARSEPATARVLWGLGVAPLAGPVFSPGYGGQNPKQPQDALVGGNGATGPIDYKFDGAGAQLLLSRGAGLLPCNAWDRSQAALAA